MFSTLDPNVYHPAGFILKALLYGVFLAVLQSDLLLASHSCPFSGIRLLEIHVTRSVMIHKAQLRQRICRGMHVNQKVPWTTFESAPIWLPSLIKWMLMGWNWLSSPLVVRGKVCNSDLNVVSWMIHSQTPVITTCHEHPFSLHPWESSSPEFCSLHFPVPNSAAISLFFLLGGPHTYQS